MIERLAEDHVNARRLADGLADMPGIIGLDPDASAHQLRVLRAAPSRAARCRSSTRLARRGCADDRVPRQRDGSVPSPTTASSAADVDRRDRRRRARALADELASRPPVAGMLPRRRETRWNADRRSPGCPADPVDQRFDARRRALSNAGRRYPTSPPTSGIHDHDGELADGTRDAKLQDIEEHKRFLNALEALDAADLSEPTVSSASWPSRVAPARCSTTRCIASGSAGPARPTRSATASSCCLPATSRRSPSARRHRRPARGGRRASSSRSSARGWVSTRAPVERAGARVAAESLPGVLRRDRRRRADGVRRGRP